MPLHLHQLQVQMRVKLFLFCFICYIRLSPARETKSFDTNCTRRNKLKAMVVTTILRLPWELSLQWRNLTSNACSLHRIWPNHAFHVSRALPSPGGASASFFQSLPFFWPLCIRIDVTFVRTNILEVVVDRPLFFSSSVPLIAFFCRGSTRGVDWSKDGA